MLPWSVIPIADISSRCASASIGATFAAPSNIEYSVWLCRCTKDARCGGTSRLRGTLARRADGSVIETPVYGRAPTRPRRVGECVLRSLAVQLDKLLQRFLDIPFDSAGRRRAHRTEQRPPAQLKTHTEGGALFGGLDGECDRVLRPTFTGSRQRDPVRRLPLGHRPRHPVAKALGTRHAHDLSSFAQLIGKLAAPSLVHHQPIAEIGQIGHALPHFLRAHRHVGREVHSGHQWRGPPRSRLPIRMPGSSRLRGTYLPPTLMALGTIPGTTLRLPASIPPIAASATSPGETCMSGILKRSALAISPHSVGTGPGHSTVTDTPVPFSSSWTASENVCTKALVAEYTAM